MKYLFTVSVPVEAENPADAQDLGWDKLVDPDGPPEGLMESLTSMQDGVVMDHDLGQTDQPAATA